MKSKILSFCYWK